MHVIPTGLTAQDVTRRLRQRLAQELWMVRSVPRDVRDTADTLGIPVVAQAYMVFSRDRAVIAVEDAEIPRVLVSPGLASEVRLWFL